MTRDPPPADRPSPPRPERQLTIRWIVTVVTLVVLTGLSWILAHTSAQSLGQEIEWCNRGGRQRMRAQRLALLAHRLATSTDPAERGELRNDLRTTAAQLEEFQHELVESFEDTAIAADTKERIHNAFKKPPLDLERRLGDCVATARAVADLPDNRLRVDAREVLDALTASDLGREAFDRLVGEFEQAGWRAADRTIERVYWLMAITAACLAASVLLVFVPFTRQLSRSLRDLRTGEARKDAMLRSALDGVVVMDHDGRIVDVNAATEHAFATTRDQLVGRRVADLMVPPRLRDAHTNGLARFLETGTGPLLGRRVEMAAQGRDGGEFPIEIAITPIPMAEGEPPLFIAFLRDISQRKEAEEALAHHVRALARSNADLEQFAYVASHDLQEPLRGVTGFASLLARRYKGRLDAQADEFIAFIEQGAARTQELIRDLLEYSVVGRREESRTRVEVKASVERALAHLKPAIDATGAQIATGPLPAVVASDVELTQVFQNLLSNAIKFHGAEPPRVEVDAERLDGSWHFRVRDHGIGLDPKFSDRIFRLFQRLHGRDDFDGNGIGLAICRKIVESHGGRIWVEAAPGAGATFHFTLPDAGKEAG
jgi:PAS domain S-box-containing protein